MVSNRSILLVEDEQSLALALQAVLSVYNSVRVAHSIREARALLRNKTPFDLVLLDKGLPDGAGMELIPELRERFPNAPIIILTGDSDYRAVTQCIEQGADDYVVKSDQTLQDLLVRIPVASAAASARVEAKSAKSKAACNLPTTPKEVTKENLAAYFDEAERAYLERALALHEDHAATVATKLGLGRSTLFKRIHDLGIARRPWRREPQSDSKAKGAV